MAWLTVGLAGANFVGGLIQGNQQRSAAQEANELQAKIDKQRYERDLQLWEIDWLRAQSDYSWKVAETEALRYQDRVRQADYEFNQGLTIDAAIQNLQLNMEALNQTYVIEERLRAQQVSNDLAFSLSSDMNQGINAFSQLGTEALNIQNQARKANVDSLNAVAQYMLNVKDKQLKATALVNQANREGQEIQDQIVIGEQLDTLRRDAEYIAAIVTGAESKAGGVARQGGSKSSKRLAQVAMQEFGRTYGLLKQEQANRRRNLDSYNARLSGEYANNAAQIATAIEGDVNNITNTRNNNILANQGFTAAFNSTGRQMLTAQNSYQISTKKTMLDFADLTIPSFGLARATGRREQIGLLQNTYNTIKGASLPYRNAVIFDPLKPIAGLKPKMFPSTKSYVPGTGTIFANAFMQGAQGAMQGAYTNAEGNLAWR